VLDNPIIRKKSCSRTFLSASAILADGSNVQTTFSPFHFFTISLFLCIFLFQLFTISLNRTFK